MGDGCVIYTMDRELETEHSVILGFVNPSRLDVIYKTHSLRVKYPVPEWVAERFKKHKILVDNLTSIKYRHHNIIVDIVRDAMIVDLRDRYIIGASPPQLSIIVRLMGNRLGLLDD